METEVIQRKKGKRFEPGGTYFNSYRPPGEAPDGFTWMIVGRSEGMNGYPVNWTLQSTDPTPPDMDELPPIDPHGKEIKQFAEPLPGLEEEKH